MEAIRLGLGIYPRVEAARLLRLTPSRLTRWVLGYTYRRHSGKVLRSHAPIIRADLPRIDHSIALSFLELMELRVVKAIVDAGVSLQHVRVAASIASERFDTEHPFASRRVFTDGRGIFSALSVESADLVEWRRGRIDQVISGEVFEPFLQEIEFNEQTSVAFKWWPKGRSVPVVLDPRVGFGAPTVEGTAVRTAVVAKMARHSSLPETASAFAVTEKGARAAVEFEEELAAA